MRPSNSHPTVALGCLDEVLRCRAIVANGTSADAQLAIYHRARDKGAEREEALTAVNQWLAEATLEGARLSNASS